MKLLQTLVIFGLSFASLAMADSEIWFKLADGSDAPAIGGQVTVVKANSFAENQNFQKGDLISTMNKGYYGYYKKVPSDPYEIEIYSIKRGTSRSLTVPGGEMGISVQFFCHPWISYLREEIGVRGAWDRDLVELMERLFKFRDARRDKWQAIVDSGYPEDDALYDLIELFFDWLDGETIKPFSFFTRWESELSPMPDTVFHLLERLALVSNDRRLLKALYDLNADNLRISKSEANFLISKGKGVDSKNGTELFDYLDSIRGPNLTKKMRSGSAVNIRDIVHRKSVSVNNGNYRLSLFLRPKNYKGKQFHYRTKLRAVGKPINSRFVPSFRIGACQYNHQTKKNGGIIGELTVLGSKSGNCSAECRGQDMFYKTWYFYLPKFPTEVIGQRALDIKDSPFTEMDFILLKDQCAVYLNGVAMGHWPIVDRGSDVCLTFFVSGAQVQFQDFDIWGLRSK